MTRPPHVMTLSLSRNRVKVILPHHRLQRVRLRIKTRSSKLPKDAEDEFDLGISGKEITKGMQGYPIRDVIVHIFYI